MRDDNYFDKVDTGSSDAGDADNSQNGVVDAEDKNTQTV